MTRKYLITYDVLGEDLAIENPRVPKALVEEIIDQLYAALYDHFDQYEWIEISYCVTAVKYPDNYNSNLIREKITKHLSVKYPLYVDKYLNLFIVLINDDCDFINISDGDNALKTFINKP